MRSSLLIAHLQFLQPISHGLRANQQFGRQGEEAEAKGKDVQLLKKAEVQALGVQKQQVEEARKELKDRDLDEARRDLVWERNVERFNRLREAPADDVRQLQVLAGHLQAGLFITKFRKVFTRGA